MSMDVKVIADPTCFEQHRLPPVSDHEVFACAEECLSGSSSLKISLNGQWRFHYAVNPGERPSGFEKDDYDVSHWAFIKVPGHFETQGYGHPQYTNTVYPWEGKEDVRPGDIPERFNPVGSYVTFFDRPDFDRTVITFEGADSALAVYLNGQYVGYSEDSFTPARFDLTPYLREGSNRLAVEVFKYSSGSHLEDQDFWRLSGLFRGVYLSGYRGSHLEDIEIIAEPDPSLSVARVEIKARLVGQPCTFTATLFSPDGEELSSLERADVTGQTELEFDLKKPQLWSAEDPKLYTLAFTLKNSEGNCLEYVRQDVGVRRFEIRDGVMCLNGRRIVFNGVNRHEFSAVSGRTVSEEEIFNDLLIMKRHNINAVRTCHYPNSSALYRLCDVLGLYVIDETNLETHGTWQVSGRDLSGEGILPGDKPEWREAVLSRGQAMLERDKNHPCILIWSCGNESNGGKTLFELSEYFRARDPRRLVHYEGIFHNRTYNGTSDMESQMYTTVANIRAFLKEHRDKPFILCEYTHSMGNSMGGMQLYTALTREDPLFQGGFIWDFRDQAFKTTNLRGESYLAYGGDFGDRPTDYNFSGNGIVFADNTLTPKLADVKYNYQPFGIEVHDYDAIRIENRTLFTDLSAYDVYVTLLRDGEECHREIYCDLSVAPGMSDTLGLEPLTEYMVKPGEYVLHVAVCLKEETVYAPAGFEVAFGEAVIARVAKAQSVSGTLRIVEGGTNVGVHGEGFDYLFNKARGTLVSMVSHGQEVLRSPVELNFWRAPTDNDVGNGLPFRQGVWKNAGRYSRCVSAEVRKDETGISLSFTHALAGIGNATARLDFSVLSDGQITTEVNLSLPGGLPDIPEVGLLVRLYGNCSELDYYGLGPTENYCDRREGARLARHHSTVADEFVPYLKPQECGNHGAVRSFKVYDPATGCGLEVVGLEGEYPDVSALPYSPEELENAAHACELPRSLSTVVKLSSRQMGVGGDDSWGAPVLDPYLNPAQSQCFKVGLRAL